MVKSRRTRKNAPQIIPSSVNNQTVPLDSETFGSDIEHAQQNQCANQLILTPKHGRKSSEADTKNRKGVGKHAPSSGSAPLSKRQRKQLERYLEKTKKRSNRGEVLAQLQALQRTVIQTPLKLKAHGGVSGSSSAAVKSSSSTNQTAENSAVAATSLLSISQAQTKGLKRHRLEQSRTTKPKKPKQRPSDSDDDEAAPNTSDLIRPTAGVATTTTLSVSTSKDFADLPVYVTNEASSLAVTDRANDSATVLLEDQTKTAVSHAAETDIDADDDRNPNAEFEFVRRLREKKETDVPESATIQKNPFQVRTFCPVQRTEAIQTSRMQLPIIGYEQQIMEMIAQNDIVVICGETGSGKTTQVPQFLYESGYASGAGMIGITEPRRVAAISMAQRVADEMNVSSSRTVAYHIRYETNVTAETKVKFMTDGVLLRELSQDFLLMKYSCIVLDEAHERSSFTDILIGLLSRIVRLRAKRQVPLKLVIMSATLRVEDFTQNVRLFPTPPPVLHVQARQYEVQLHYNKRTPDNYLLAAYKKVCKIHQQLPAGSILVFVTGQQEVHTLCRWLRQTFRNSPPIVLSKGSGTGRRSKLESSTTAAEATVESDADHADEKSLASEAENASEEAAADSVNLDSYSTEPIEEDDERFVSMTQKSSGFTSTDTAAEFDRKRRFDRSLNDAALNAIDDAEEGDDAELINTGMDDTDLLDVFASSSSSEPMRVLPLYSLLSTDRQQQVFELSPPGVRTCIIATNVAETSLTLPGVRYVVDCGKVKAKLYDPVTGASTFTIMWTSKASAEQRSGRAGRIASGHCYRLYSSAVYNDQFEQYTPCEIVRRPIPDLVLQMKAMHIIKVDNFPFPTPPSGDSVRAAERELVQLGALTLSEQENDRDGGDSVAEAVAAARVGAVAAIARAQKVSQSVLRRRVAKAKQQQQSAVGIASAPQPIARITPLGQAMAQIPLMPRYSKALVLAVQKSPDLLPYLIAVVSALTVPEVLLDGVNSSDDANSNSAAYSKALQALKKRWVSSSQQTLLFGDLGVLLKAVGGAEYAGCSRDWCESHGLRYKAMLEIRHLRHQLTSIVSRVFADDLKLHKNKEKLGADISGNLPTAIESGNLKLIPPTDGQLERMRQIMLKSMSFQVARRADDSDLASYEQTKQQTATVTGDDAAATQLTKQDLQRAYKCIKTDEFVFIHPASVLSSDVKTSSQLQLPQYVLFQDLFESKGRRRRLYLRHILAVDPDWLPSLAPEFCHFEEMVRTDAVTGALIDLDVNADTLHEVFDNGSVFYDAAKGKIMCRRRCTWGPLLWPVTKPAVVPYAENIERTKLFAAYFIRGDVFSAMKKFTPSLKWPPNVLLKSWSKLLPHTQALMRALVNTGVDSKSRMESVWRGARQRSGAEGSEEVAPQPVFLLEEYLMWLPEHLHGTVRNAWPPLKQ